ncbi:hypothetical protein JTB14_036830 [Gonioctena quinquepunctata]|nr:hypothetical protein JTB14_036830 [Gonioctena quinquepunctata]
MIFQILLILTICYQNGGSTTADLVSLQTSAEAPDGKLEKNVTLQQNKTENLHKEENSRKERQMVFYKPIRSQPELVYTTEKATGSQNKITKNKKGPRARYNNGVTYSNAPKARYYDARYNSYTSLPYSTGSNRRVLSGTDNGNKKVARYNYLPASGDPYNRRYSTLNNYYSSRYARRPVNSGLYQTGFSYQQGQGVRYQVSRSPAAKVVQKPSARRTEVPDSAPHKFKPSFVMMK